MQAGYAPCARGPVTESHRRRPQAWMWAATALLLLLPRLALGQNPSFSLQLRREFGYGGSGEIQGRFRLIAQGPADLQRVTFWMDSQVVREMDQPPWEWSFHTDAFREGLRTLHATGWTRSGLELPSETIQVRFVSASGARLAALRMVALLLGGVGIVLAISGTLTLWLSRGPKSGDPNHARPWWSRLGRQTSPAAASTRPHTDPERPGFLPHSRTEGEGRLRWELEQSRFVDLRPLPSSQSAHARFDKSDVLCDTRELKGDDGNE